MRLDNRKKERELLDMAHTDFLENSQILYIYQVNIVCRNVSSSCLLNAWSQFRKLMAA